MNELSKYLDMEYLKWQQREGGSRTLEEFADHLDVDRPTLSVWMNPKSKRTPSERSLEKLACKLGFEIYDVLGKERPDPRLFSINKKWPTMSEEGKQRIAEEAAKYDPEEARGEN